MATGEMLSYDKVPYEYLEIIEKIIKRFAEREKVEYQNRLDPASTFNVFRREGTCYDRYVQVSFCYISGKGFFVAFIPNLVYYNPLNEIRKVLPKVPIEWMAYVGFSIHGVPTDVQKNDFERAVLSALETSWDNSYRITPDMLQELK